MEELKTKAEQSQVDRIKENPTAVSATAAKSKETKLQKTTTSSTVEDLDVFLLGDLGSDDEGLGMQYSIYTFFYHNLWLKIYNKCFCNLNGLAVFSYFE